MWVVKKSEMHICPPRLIGSEADLIRVWGEHGDDWCDINEAMIDRNDNSASCPGSHCLARLNAGIIPYLDANRVVIIVRRSIALFARCTWYRYRTYRILDCQSWVIFVGLLVSDPFIFRPLLSRAFTITYPGKICWAFQIPSLLQTTNLLHPQ
jgi:hypothetical protein